MVQKVMVNFAVIWATYHQRGKYARPGTDKANMRDLQSLKK